MTKATSVFPASGGLMKILVVADSEFGNTWSVAGAIADVFGEAGRALRPEHALPEDVLGLDLFVVGSPTQGGRPLPSITTFLKRLPEGAVRRTPVAAFDTRIDAKEQGLPLRLLMVAIGYAAPKIARELTARGAWLVVSPEGFIVEYKDGPVREGELERAEAWARALLEAAQR
jgi:flavodoxin